jgi:hypothetical protein
LIAGIARLACEKKMIPPASFWLVPFQIWRRKSSNCGIFTHQKGENAAQARKKLSDVYGDVFANLQ